MEPDKGKVGAGRGQSQDKGDPAGPNLRNIVKQCLKLISRFGESLTAEHVRLKYLQEVMSQMDKILSHPQYQMFINEALLPLLKYLEAHEPQFIQESMRHQCRRMIIELIKRLPLNDLLKPHIPQILSTMFKTVEIDNEDNVINCLRVIVQIHKRFRPPITQDTIRFLGFAMNIFKELQKKPKLEEMMKQSSVIHVHGDISEGGGKPYVDSIFTMTPTRNTANSGEQPKILLPRSRNSLKLLQEIPSLVVLYDEIYKNIPEFQKWVGEFSLLCIRTISLNPVTAQQQQQQQQTSHEPPNKDTYLELLTAQAKSLSFLAYKVKTKPDDFNPHGPLLALGFLNLLKLCPMEAASVLREIFTASRFILTSKLCTAFAPYVKELLDDLIVKGSMLNEAIRPTGYSVVGDLIYRIRTELSSTDVIRAVLFFSAELHDESLSMLTQAFCIRILNSLAEQVQNKCENGVPGFKEMGCDILMRILAVLAYKLKTIAEVYLPLYQKTMQLDGRKYNASKSKEGSLGTEGGESTKAPVENCDDKDSYLARFPLSAAHKSSMSDCKTLVKNLICAVHATTKGLISLQSKEPKPTATSVGNTFVRQFGELGNVFDLREFEILLEIMRWGLKILEIYTLVDPETSEETASSLQARSKEVLQFCNYFASIFFALSHDAFNHLLRASMDMILKRIEENPGMILVANAFMSLNKTCPIFLTILMDAFLERMEILGGDDADLAQVYLKLFRCGFSSLKLFPKEAEPVLQSYIQPIVTKATSCARHSKNPLNYYVLLVSLSRYINSPDTNQYFPLHQQLVPVLPLIFKSLKCTQFGIHRQQVKDVIGELCFTMSGRLSDLLPYLPQLMEPLITSLSGSPTLISHALRMVDIIIDCFHPEFLSEYMEPIATELIQALWSILRSPYDSLAKTAFKILGKLAGSNRKALMEPPQVQLQDEASSGNGQCLGLKFMEYKTSISLPIEKVVEVAVKTVGLTGARHEIYYVKQSWEFLKRFVFASLGENVSELENHFDKMLDPTLENETGNKERSQRTKENEKCMAILSSAITGWILSTTVNEIKKDVYLNLTKLLRHFTLIIIAQHEGGINGRPNQMDPYVIFDGLFGALVYQEKDVRKGVKFAFSVIMNCVIELVRSKEKAFSLPMVEYITDKIINLCYESVGHSKLGGCELLGFLLDNASPLWIFTNHLHILKVLLFVLVDVHGVTSLGCVEVAKANITKLIESVCVVAEDLSGLQTNCLNNFVIELSKSLTSPNQCIREECRNGLELMAELRGTTVSALMYPHYEVLKDMIPPKKHHLQHQSVPYQLGILEGTAYCFGLRPKLFSLNLNEAGHQTFFKQLTKDLCQDEQDLLKLPCYKYVSEGDIVAIKKAVISVISTLTEMPSSNNNFMAIFIKHLLFPSTSSPSSSLEMQKHAFKCLKKFAEEEPVSMNIQITAVNKLIGQFHKNVTNVTVEHLTQFGYLYQVFPLAIQDIIWTKFTKYYSQLANEITAKYANHENIFGNEELNLCVAFLDVCQLRKSDNTEVITEMVKTLCIGAKKLLHTDPGNVLRESLTKLVLKFPKEFLRFAFESTQIKDMDWTHFVLHVINQDEAVAVRQAIMNDLSPLINWMKVTNSEEVAQMKAAEQERIQYFVIRVFEVLNEYNGEFLTKGHGRPRNEVVDALLALWCNPMYQFKLTSKFLAVVEADPTISDNPKDTQRLPQPVSTVEQKLASKLEMQRWKEPEIIVKLLLSYFMKNPREYEILFHLFRAFSGLPLLPYNFLNSFLQNTAPNYSVQWKREAFFKFCLIFKELKKEEELKAKIIQFLFIPCFAHSFENGLVEELINGTAAPVGPYLDSLVNKVINDVIPEKGNSCLGSDLHIALFQLCSLFLKYAPNHFYENNEPNNRIRKMVGLAWPTILNKSPLGNVNMKHYGNMLLSHIAANFNINRRIIIQVFNSLVKVQSYESKEVINEALDVLIPAIPKRVEDGMVTLAQLTKKALIDLESGSLQQFLHIIQLIVRHWQIYYPVRHVFISHMIRAMQLLASATASPTQLEHKKLAVSIAEIMIKWEVELMRKENFEAAKVVGTPSPSSILANSNSCNAGGIPNRPGLEVIRQAESQPLNSRNAHLVLIFLMKTYIKEVATADSVKLLLGRKSLALLKLVIKPELWQAHLNDIDISWMVKPLMQTSNPKETAPAFPHAIAILEILTLLVGTMPKQIILKNMKLFFKGVIMSMTNPRREIQKAVQNFLTKLMSIFPCEYVGAAKSSSFVYKLPKFTELEPIYIILSKLVNDSLTSYEKMENNTKPQFLWSALMLVKAASASNPNYIDRFISLFMKCLEKLAKEHLQEINAGASSESTEQSLLSESLAISLDLVKNRVGVMGLEMRKSFIGFVLVGLIEKSTDKQILQTIVKMVEEWMKSKDPMVINQGPTIMERSILLVKLMQNVEKRFAGEQDLVGNFLHLIHFIYSDEQLKSTELSAKLEQAFLIGLRSSDPEIREMFAQVFNKSIKRTLYDRFIYILCSQNWEAMGLHYWIKQCEELVFATVQKTKVVLSPKEAWVFTGVKDDSSLLNMQAMMMSVDDVQLLYQDSDQQMLVSSCNSSLENNTQDPTLNQQQLQSNIDQLEACDGKNAAAVGKAVERLEDDFIKNGWKEAANSRANVKIMIERGKEFIAVVTEMNSNVQGLVKPIVQLCHYDTALAEALWLQLFPRIWKILSEKEQTALANEMAPFLCSGVHVLQQWASPSPLNTFVEGICRCVPVVPLKPKVMHYLGKTHNLWHRMCLLLEQLTFEGSHSSPSIKLKIDRFSEECHEVFPTAPQDQVFKHPSAFSSNSTASKVARTDPEVFDTLSSLYRQLREEDLWAGLWQRRARYAETKIAVAMEQQGYYEKAQGAYEMAMSKGSEEFPEGLPTANIGEAKLWTERWLKCAEELNQWDVIEEYSQSNPEENLLMLLESSWRKGNWNSVKTLTNNSDSPLPREQSWKLSLLNGYSSILNLEQEQRLDLAEQYADIAQNKLVKEWKRFPLLVTDSHVGILQAAQKIMELREAVRMHRSVKENLAESAPVVKVVLRTWKHRQPCIAEEFRHWSHVLSWRSLNYNIIGGHFDNWTQIQQNVNPATREIFTEESPKELIIHSNAQGLLCFSKIARKHHMVGVALESLSKLYTTPSLHINDCFQMVKQQVKCYRHQALILKLGDLQEALNLMEATNLDHFSPDINAEFFAVKGKLYELAGKSDDANKAFSSSMQLLDSVPKNWGKWGEYLENVFIQNPNEIHTGISAVTALMHAARHQCEKSGKKHIAKILWLLMYDDEGGSLAKALNKYYQWAPAIQWLNWVPQLLYPLTSGKEDGVPYMNILNHIGRTYPMAVYFPIRVLYLSLKMDEKKKIKNKEYAAQQQRRQGMQMDSQNGFSPITSQTSENAEGIENEKDAEGSPQPPLLKASKAMWRCSKLMHMQRDFHPTVLSTLEGIVDQIISLFVDNQWYYEELLKQLKVGLARCYEIALENPAEGILASTTNQLNCFVEKLISTFGPNCQMLSQLSNLTLLSKVENASVQEIQKRLLNDFKNLDLRTLTLQILIQKLRKWIKFIQQRAKSWMTSIPYDDRTRFLLSFNPEIAQIELPGECLSPKLPQNYVKIVRFLPKMEIVLNQKTKARRMYIRGHNGKVYPYLITSDSAMNDNGKEDRVFQLMRMLNHYLSRQKVTARKCMQFTVPKFLSVSPTLRLIEDSPHNLNFLEVYESYCSKKHMEADLVVSRSFDRLALLQARGGAIGHHVLSEIYRDMQATLVPRTVLKEWAWDTFATPSDYWMFRKFFTTQMCLLAFAEEAFSLTHLYPDKMIIHKDTGKVHAFYYVFDFAALRDNATTSPVPFRITPNISEFITPHGMNSVINGIIAIGQALSYPNYMLKSILRTILKDEVITFMLKKQRQGELEGQDASDCDLGFAIRIVNSLVNETMIRISDLSTFDGTESKANTLVTAANNADNLCRMDPTWFPWL